MSKLLSSYSLAAIDPRLSDSQEEMQFVWLLSRRLSAEGDEGLTNQQGGKECKRKSRGVCRAAHRSEESCPKLVQRDEGLINQQGGKECKQKGRGVCGAARRSEASSAKLVQLSSTTMVPTIESSSGIVASHHFTPENGGEYFPVILVPFDQMTVFLRQPCIDRLLVDVDSDRVAPRRGGKPHRASSAYALRLLRGHVTTAKARNP